MYRVYWYWFVHRFYLWAQGGRRRTLLKPLFLLNLINSIFNCSWIGKSFSECFQERLGYVCQILCFTELKSGYK